MHYPPGKVYTHKIPSVKYSVAKTNSKSLLMGLLVPENNHWARILKQNTKLWNDLFY